MPECVYFIDTEDGKHVKIGYSTDIKKRLSAIQVSSPQRLVLRGWIEGDRNVEANIHARFPEEWSSGEWFRRTERLDQFIESIGIQSSADVPAGEVIPRAAIDTSVGKGRLSDLLKLRRRADWSKLTAKLGYSDLSVSDEPSKRT